MVGDADAGLGHELEIVGAVADGDPKRCGEKILEAIQAAWTEEAE